MVYLGLDINNTELQIDHIDRCKTNNNSDNLRIVTNQENTFNTNAKGYFWDKKSKKWRSVIMINNKIIILGYFDTEEEAHNAYLEGKQKYHIINHHRHSLK
jgi:hypothetical protein